MQLMTNKAKITSSFKRMLSNESGNTALFFGMATLPLMLILGASVDFERAATSQVALQSAVDSAALYAASLTNTEDESLTDNSKPYFNANYKAVGGSGTPTYSVTNSGDSVSVVASANIPNSFMSIIGMASTSVGATAVVKKAGINLEVSMVLDNTGSMNSVNAQTGNTAIADLKSAAKKFVGTVMPETQGQYYTKIAAVPYNNGVNLGNMAATARGSIANGTSTTPGSQNYTFSTNYLDTQTYNSRSRTWSWGQSCDHDSDGYCTQTLPITNCVTERTGNDAYTDVSVSTSPVGRAYQPSGNSCSVQQMVPLTTSASTLTTMIDNMSAGNSTAGHVGIAWGWYALSPSIGMWSGSSQPAGYDKLTATDLTKKVKKVMVLMTDGEYNSAMYNGVIAGIDNTYGSSGNPYYGSVPGSGGPFDHIGHEAANGNPYTQTTSMCNAIKASGVEVYVITFQLNTSVPARVALASNCATDAGHIFNADTTSLDSAFTKIANQIQDMRIAQ